MPGKAAGRAAADLPWLCPTTDSLIALADAPASVAGLLAADPALAVFVLRFAQPAQEPDPFGLAPGALHSAVLPETAAAFLAASAAGVVPRNTFVAGRVRARAARAGAIASALAGTTRLVPEAAANLVTRLAPLGWYAVQSVDPFDAADPLGDPDFITRPAETQQKIWGLDHESIVRRLASRWRLPAWAATTIGNLTHPFSVAVELVAHRDLFAITQLALVEAESESHPLGLTHGARRVELLEYLHLDTKTVRTLAAAACEPAPIRESALDPNPHQVPLVRNLLRLAGESRRRNGPGLVMRLEDQIDALHRVVAQLGEQAGERLREARLMGLAELAAGAGHEINNPLAIISGNAQRLLRAESDSVRGESLQAIVRQANRIAGLVRDLMQFARPPRPELRSVLAADLIRDVLEGLRGLAEERDVRIDVNAAAAGMRLDGDPRQLGHALGAVVRNALEAVPRGGWIALSAEDDGTAVPTITVEDSGPGLAPDAADHAFDPFYCGRSAGRGRGLGLPTAWRLIRQNGGDLRHDPTPEGRTRFILSFQRSPGHDLLTLRSA